jgi:hypothetical protein
MAEKRNMMLAGVIAVLVACADASSPTALPLADQAGLAKGGGGGGTTYKARFIVGSIPEGDGEISSDWFPSGGYSISANNPWRQVTIGSVSLNLNNFTHGDLAHGTCAVFIANTGSSWNLSNWDIAGTNPVRTYAGTWFGSVTFSRGYFAFDGDRVGGAGGIHNAVSQSNVVVETVGPNKDWFRQEFRNAGLKFGSASTPDGAPLLNPELACANFTIELRKTSLIP